MNKSVRKYWCLGNVLLVLFVKLDQCKSFDFGDSVLGKCVRNGDNLLKMNELKAQITASPALSFRFVFPLEQKTVKVHINSDDDSCMSVFVRQPKCPYFDLENIIRFNGYWLTMTKSGSIIVPNERFPEGFFIILYVHKNNNECETKYGKNIQNKSILSDFSYTDDNNNDPTSRSKIVNIEVVDILKQDIVIFELIWPFGIIVLLGILTSAVLLFTNYKEAEAAIRPHDEEMARNDIELNSIHNKLEEEENGTPLVIPVENQQETEIPEKPKSCCKNIFSPPPSSELVTLNQTAKKSSENLDKNSTMFLLFVFPVAIYYCLPAIQLVFFYLFTSHKTGNLDLCYYNFRCAYPYWFFNDFNHVWSNICYVLVGALGFVLVHFHKQKYLKKSSYGAGHGVPPQFGLSKALAFTILIEGLLSASYHICPNRSNFHHDTCFMYVAVTLLALKLYHSRHPDTALGATKAFALLGIVIVADLLGEMFEYLWYFLLFSLLHFATLVILATELYYMGRRSIFSPSIFGSIWTVLRNDRCGHSDITPVASKDVYWLIILGFVTNIFIFVGCGLIPFLDETLPVFDFGTYLLTILGGNTVIYLFYYLVMKCVHGEGLSWVTWFLFVLSFGFWIPGVVFFGKIRTSWEESPANSRNKNQECDTYFYDTHDLWHILSSGGLYTTLMLLEFIDVDLWKKPQNKIAVF